MNIIRLDNAKALRAMGLPLDTPVPLVAGYRVVSSDNHETISIEYEPPAGPQ